MKFALVGREETIGHVDGDALLALGRQAIHQQRKIQILSLGTTAPAVLLQGGELILENHPAVIQQPADQRGLPVIDAAAGHETQQGLVLVLDQVGIDILRDQRIGLVSRIRDAVVHQK
jgi:hypothetical protein